MGRRIVQYGHFSDKEVWRFILMRTFELFSAKTLNFSKFIVCMYGQRGRRLNQCGHFASRGSIFCNFVQACFMDGR